MVAAARRAGVVAALALLALPAFAQDEPDIIRLDGQCWQRSTKSFVECPVAEPNWSASILGGAVQTITPGERNATGTQPLVRLDVDARLTPHRRLLSLEVGLSLTGSNALDISDPSTVKALEGSVSLVLCPSKSLWVCGYGETGAAAYLGEDGSPGYFGTGLQFQTKEREAKLKIGYAYDARLTGESLDTVKIEGWISLEPLVRLPLVFGGDWSRSFSVWGYLDSLFESVARVRIWVAGRFGK